MKFIKKFCFVFLAVNAFLILPLNQVFATLNDMNGYQSDGGFPEDKKGAWQSGIDVATTTSGLSDRRMDWIFVGLLRWGLGALMFVAVCAFIVSGYMYITAGGQAQQIQTATKGITYSIVGLIVALLSYTLVAQIDILIRGKGLLDIFFDQI